MTANRHGGRRAGAGRPKSGTKSRKISIRLSADNYARLKGGLWKGRENMSACINYIIEVYFKEVGPRD